MRIIHSTGSKPTFCCVLGEDIFPCLVVLESSSKLQYSYISIKSKADSNILASTEAGRGNCLPYVLAPPSSQADKYSDKLN